MKELLITLLVLLILIISGCDNLELNKVSNEDLEMATENVVKEDIDFVKQNSIKQEDSLVCPQFYEVQKTPYNNVKIDDYIIEGNYDGIIDQGLKDIDGWKMEGGYINIIPGNPPGIINFVRCHKGSKQNENINYFYCGEDSISPLLAVKRITDSAGNIKKVLKIEIILVMDDEGNFVETICK